MLRRARRAGAVGAVCCLCLGCLSLGGPLPASAQTTVPAPTTTTTLAPPITVAPATTTTAPPTILQGPTTTSTLSPTTVAPVTPPHSPSPPPTPTTSANLAPQAWTANIPGPPPPPAAVAASTAAATPADIALANQLESQIAAQSRILDVLAERYDRAQQAVADATAKLSDIQAQMTAAQTNGTNTQAGISQTQSSLKAVAVDAYVGSGASSPRLSGRFLLAAYEQGMARAVSETAVGKAFDTVRQLQQAQNQLKQVQADLHREQQLAAAANTAARTAALQSQADALAAAQQQTQLLATLSQAQGNLGPLVAAAEAARAQAAYARFSTQKGLDFTVFTPLPGVLAQTSGVIAAATAQLGKPYVWGGNGPDTFDCSGLMKWAWAQMGVTIPRVAADQQSWATPVPISQLAPGDLVFFGNPAHHVGMYIGSGMMIDAPHSGAFVETVPIWWDELAGFGRVHQP